jgi:hypothetical protein
VAGPLAGDARAASPSRPGIAGGASLPELANVWWRRRLDERGLLLRERLSFVYTAVYCTPLIAAGVILIALEPLLFPVSLVAWLHAWVIPELFAHRGTRVVFPLGQGRARTLERGGGLTPEQAAQGLLADLLDHEARALQRDTGLALERGRLGVWLVGEAGALLVRPGGRRVHCFCARVTDPQLPRSDRIAHLLLALREDETGFATLANHAFAGARWRVRRRLRGRQRPALAAAADAAQAAQRRAPAG